MTRTALILAAIVLSASASVAQTTWHVDASATPPGNGSASQPYVDLQFALAQSSTVSGDTVLVEPGTYVGAFDFLGKNVTVQSTQGAAVTILDGNDQLVSVVSFVNGEGPGAVLDGFTVTRGRGSLSVFAPVFNYLGTIEREGGGIRCANSSPALTNLRVVRNRAPRGAGVLLLNSAAVLSHSTIAENNGDSFPFAAGIGVFSNLPTATIEFCTIESNPWPFPPPEAIGAGFCGRALIRDTLFRANRAGSGSGAFVLGATFERCTFQANIGYIDCVQSVRDGGGISHMSLYNQGQYAVLSVAGIVAGPTLVDACVFVDNEATRGGAISCNSTGTVIVTDSLFAGNLATGSCPGSGWYAEGGAVRNAQLFDCELTGNRSTMRGGAVAFGSATRCMINGNVVEIQGGSGLRGGGGAYGADLSECALFDNSVIKNNADTNGPAVGGGSWGGTANQTYYARNTAQYGGGAAGGTLMNCTFYDNLATVDGGSMAATSGSLTPVNSLVALNVIARLGSPNELALQGSSATINMSYCDVQGGYAGAGNFDLAPLFFAPNSGDFHLKAGSPCIDAGDPSSPLDPDGSRADVGAFAFDVNYCSTPGAWCAGKENSLGCVPEMGFTGTPSASGADNFFVTGSNFLGSTFGLLAWSRTPNSIPFQNGTLCLQGPFFRAGLQVSSGSFGACDGTYSFHFSQSYRALFGINTLDTIYAQWFARDVLNPDGTGWSLSNAIEFTVCP